MDKQWIVGEGRGLGESIIDEPHSPAISCSETAGGEPEEEINTTAASSGKWPGPAATRLLAAQSSSFVDRNRRPRDGTMDSHATAPRTHLSRAAAAGRSHQQVQCVVVCTRAGRAGGYYRSMKGGRDRCGATTNDTTTRMDAICSRRSRVQAPLRAWLFFASHRQTAGGGRTPRPRVDTSCARELCRPPRVLLTRWGLACSMCT
jgi:hypothetical protein